MQAPVPLACHFPCPSPPFKPSSLGPSSLTHYHSPPGELDSGLPLCRAPSAGLDLPTKQTTHHPQPSLSCFLSLKREVRGEEDRAECPRNLCSQALKGSHLTAVPVCLPLLPAVSKAAAQASPGLEGRESTHTLSSSILPGCQNFPETAVYILT